MKGDFTRFPFDPKKHYSGVFKQQGRVDLDADWNEYVEMQKHLDRVKTRDTIGPCGVPISGKESGGFEITADEEGDLQISPGNIYVDGILCQLEDITTYLNQEDYPGRPELIKRGTDLVYLDVWMRHITAIEDPDIRETALGGPDTTTRIKTIWQVKVVEAGENVQECADFKDEDWDQLAPTKPSKGRLTTSFSPAEDTANPCAPIAEAGYSGLENRLYRVEIHDADDRYALEPKPMSPGQRIGYPVERVNDAHKLTMADEGWSTEGQAFAPGQVVEVSSERENGQFRSILSRIVKVDDARRALTLNINLSDLSGDKNFYVTKVATFKWSRDNGSVVFPVDEFDDKRTIKLKRLGRDQVLTLHNEDWVEVLDDVSELSGEHGSMAQIIGDPDLAGFSITLDRDISGYSKERKAKVRRWDQKSDAIPVNTDNPIDLEDGIKIQFSGSNFKTGDYWVFAARTTGEVETLENAPPRGIEHHYCRLALIKWTTNDYGSITADVADCRKKFKPLTELGSNGCGTVTVGDGKTSKGDYDDIQDAVNSVIKKGAGRVCILPGKHNLGKTIKISEFHPEKEAERVPSFPDKAVLTIYGCGPQTQIFGPDNLDPAFNLENSASVLFKSLSIEVKPAQNAIVLKDCDFIEVSGCKIDVAMGNEKSDFAPFAISQSRKVTIKDNIFICRDMYKHVAVSMSGENIFFYKNELYGVGVWVKGSSQDISIKENAISGASAGIILGGRMDPTVDYAKIERTTISDNYIFGMKNSGICTMDDKKEIDIDDLIIDHNRIFGCAQEGIDNFYHGNAVGGVVLRDTSRIRICGNHISQNGQKIGFEDEYVVKSTGKKLPEKGGLSDEAIVQDQMVETHPDAGGDYNPSCGIFVHMCKGLEVTGNEIVDNGAFVQPGGVDNNVYQAGIVALNVAEDDSSTRSLSYIGQVEAEVPYKAFIPKELPSFRTGLPAAVISNNVVVTPSGHALIIIGSGQMLIKANTLTSRGRWSQPKFIFDHKLAQMSLPILDEDVNSCVFILNLGLSLVLARMIQSRLTKKTDASVSNIAGSDAVRISENTVVTWVQTLLLNPLNGIVLFQGNQVTLQIEDQLDTAAIDIQNNDTKDKIKLLFYLILSSKIKNLSDLISSEDLRALFRGELANEKIHGLASNLVMNTMGTSIIIASLDDISFQDNQVITIARGRVLICDVLAAAPTIRASGNRFSEEQISFTNIFGTLFSLFSAGIWNLTKENQANNCLIVMGAGSSIIDNQVIFDNYCQELRSQAPVENKVLAVYPSEDTATDVAAEKYDFSSLYDIIPGTLASVMLSFADEHAKSAERLNIAASRAKEIFQQDHPMVASILRRASEHNAVDQAFRTSATKLAGNIRTKPIDWTIFGKVMDKDRKPV